MLAELAEHSVMYFDAPKVPSTEFVWFDEFRSVCPTFGVRGGSLASVEVGHSVGECYCERVQSGLPAGRPALLAGAFRIERPCHRIQAFQGGGLISYVESEWGWDHLRPKVTTELGGGLAGSGLAG